MCETSHFGPDLVSKSLKEMLVVLQIIFVLCCVV